MPDTTFPIISLTIYNRFGKEIHYTTNGIWDGGESPAGVYYWHLKYHGCDQPKDLKGWVQLIR
jgi:hypothetical protein